MFTYKEILTCLYVFDFRSWWGIIIVFLIVQNITLLCSIIFKRHIFLKASIITCILAVAYFSLNSKLAALVNQLNPEFAILVTEKYARSGDPDLTFAYKGAAPIKSIQLVFLKKQFFSIGNIPATNIYMEPSFLRNCGCFTLACYLVQTQGKAGLAFRALSAIKKDLTGSIIS